MKISLKWLRDYVNLGIPAPEIAHRLTMAGLEVKTIQSTGGEWDNIVVAAITAVNPHPNADRLRLATLDLGNRSITVVCGAPNLTVGDKVPFAMIGAKLRDGHTGQLVQLKPVKIRGVVSEGMVCAEKELGISENYAGIMVLPPDAPVGAPLAEYLGDTIFDIEVTPNRPDCLSVLGIAHEVAALAGRPLTLLADSYPESATAVSSMASVEILAPDLCPRYCCSVITGIKVGPSPQWLQQRLLASGMRPINNIVDATNYVMLEYGQPLHAFDYERLEGHRIVVRRPQAGEVIISLDGSEHKLAPEMLVIADTRRAVAIAGVMGGLNSEIFDSTTTVLLESASFNPASIRRTSAALRLRTEASIRFERGISRELTFPALRRVTQLIQQLAGGAVCKGIIDVYPGRQPAKKLPLKMDRIERLLGMAVSKETAVRTLESLGYSCEDSAGEVMVTAPYWRSDVTCLADLAEDIARIIGYDKVPVTLLGSPLPEHQPPPQLAFREAIRDTMVTCGFQEVITYSLTSTADIIRLSPDGTSYGPEPARVANPLSQEQDCLRTTLRNQLLACLARNQKYESGGIRLFEIGKVFLPGEKGQPREVEMLCAVLSGTRSPLSWRSDGKAVDFFDARGAVEAAFRQVGVKLGLSPAGDISLQSGRTAGISAGGRAVGIVGEIHPRVAGNFELPGSTFLIEINLDELLSAASSAMKFQPLPRFPSVVRDIAIITSRSVTWEKIESTVRGFPLVTSCRLFDLYAGAPVPADKQSLAFRITFQSPERTLTDEEVALVHQQIVDRLSKDFGATLRG